VQLERVHPIVPLNPASQGLTVGVLSYDGTVCFGLLADRALEPPLETVSAALADALGELIA
jgi:diacylglycerol O-acyltransferase / wax synthase